MVVGRFGVRAVVDKGGETCDQGGVCRQSDGKHVTRAGFSTEGFAWLPLYHLRNSSNFICFHAFAMLFSFICHCRAGLVGRVVVVAEIVVKHR